jgi:hypothetical protein
MVTHSVVDKFAELIKTITRAANFSFVNYLPGINPVMLMFLIR